MNTDAYIGFLTTAEIEHAKETIARLAPRRADLIRLIKEGKR